MIRNILCDIGNVLLAFDLAPAITRLNHREDLPAAAAEAILVHHRDQMETGQSMPEDFLRTIMREFAFPGTMDEARAIFADIFTPIVPLWDVMRNLHADGLRLVLFSNISPIHADFVLGRYEIFRLFAESVFSFRTGAMKPDDGMYTEAVDALGLVPHETLYIDDNVANIETGKRFDFHCHVYDMARHDALAAVLAALRVGRYGAQPMGTRPA